MREGRKKKEKRKVQLSRPISCEVEISKSINNNSKKISSVFPTLGQLCDGCQSACFHWLK